MTLLLLPSISRVVVIDFSVARHHDEHIFRTNRNGTESIVEAVEESLLVKDQKNTGER